MKNVVSNLLIIMACSCCLLGIGPGPSFEYRVWAGAPPNVDLNRPADSTFTYDGGWHEKGSSSDQWVLSRNSQSFVRLRAAQGHESYWAHGVWKPAECNVGPFQWAVAPSGHVGACVTGDHPSQTIHIVNPRDGTRIALIPVPTGWVEGRNTIAFADDDHLLFAALDDSCPRDSMRLRYSIAEVSVAHPEQIHIAFRCASGVSVGNSHVAYLRKNGTQYSLGNGWIDDAFYGFDKDDNAITDDYPAIRQFKADHPSLAVWLVSVGRVPSSP